MTKAVHRELVTDLTTEVFLACLRRMVARRGLCSVIWANNATNFRRADLELSPRLPHMGGLWEATVKGVKRHLYTVMQNIIFTYKECYSLLVEIEARPSSPLTDDSNDIIPLTPALF